MTPEITSLIRRLRLTPTDVLGLAREIACDATLRSTDFLTRHQWRQLHEILEFLAEPCAPIDRHRARCAA